MASDSRGDGGDIAITKSLAKDQLGSFWFALLLMTGLVIGCGKDEPTTGPGRLDLGITGGTNDDYSLIELSQDEIKLHTSYYDWVELEPSLGVHEWAKLDEEVGLIEAAGMSMALEIEITATNCTNPERTDEECILHKLPDGLTFSRLVNNFDEDQYVQPLKGLVRAIIERYQDRGIITHLYIGNETDSYLRAVEDDTGRDLFPSFKEMIRQIQEEVTQLPSPRPKFGTVFTFWNNPEHDQRQREISQVVDVMGITAYPTDPDLGDTSPLEERIPSWLARISDVTEGRPSAITEIGHGVVAPDDTPASERALFSLEGQERFARILVGALKANPDAFEYVSWFSLYGYHDLTHVFFAGMGLKDRTTDTKRPAYDVWARQEN